MTIVPLHWLDHIQPHMRRDVGDKAYYLGLASQRGYPIVPGFVISAGMFREFLEQINWLEPFFTDLPHSMLHLNINNPRQLQAIAQQIRQRVSTTPLKEDWLAAIGDASRSFDTAPALIFRPSIAIQNWPQPALSQQIRGLLASKTCRVEPGAVASSLNACMNQCIRDVWAELFRAKSLFYWQQAGIQLQRIQFGVIVQPLVPAMVSGLIHPTARGYEVKACWGLGKMLTTGEVPPDRYDVRGWSSTPIQQEQPPKLYAYGIVGETLAGLAVEPSESTPTMPNLDPERQTVPWVRSDGLCRYTLDPVYQNRPILTEADVKQLGELAQQLQLALSSPVALEWTLGQSPIGADAPGQPWSLAGREGRLYVTQLLPEWVTTPETAVAAQTAQAEPDAPRAIARERVQVMPLATGLGAAPGRVVGRAWVVGEETQAIAHLPPGHILVAPDVPPGWLLEIEQSVGIVSERGGLTCHAGILARELGIPAVVGVDRATQQVKTGDVLLLDGDRGLVVKVEPETGAAASGSEQPSGIRPEIPPAPESQPLHPDQDWLLPSAEPTRQALPDDVPGSGPSPVQEPMVKASSRVESLLERLTAGDRPNATRLMVSLSQVTTLDAVAALPVDGLGLLRSEMLLLSLLERRSPADWVQAGEGEALTQRIQGQIEQVARAFHPRPVFYRSLHLRSHEFSMLLGDRTPSPEPNPILGAHGTWSYVQDPAVFQIELTALRRVQQAGYANLRLILPFVRTVEEFAACQPLIQQAGLTQEPDFQTWIMAEVPSVLLLLPDYVAAGVQGIAIGTNDLTQLLLGVDRDHPQMSQALTPRHEAVLRAIRHLVQTANRLQIPCSVCGQAPSLYPDLVERLIEWGVDALSVTPDAVEATQRAIAQAERRLLLRGLQQGR